MKVVPAANLEELVRKLRKMATDHADNRKFYESDPYYKFADELSALASAAVNVPVEAQGKPDALPVIGPNTYRGEDGSVSVLGTSTGVRVRPITDEQKREMVGWVVKELGEVDGSDFSFERRAIAEEIVSKILDWPTPSAERLR